MLSQGRIDFNQQTKKIISKKKKLYQQSQMHQRYRGFFVIVPLDAAIRHNSPI